MVGRGHFAKVQHKIWFWLVTRESNKGVMTVRKYSFLLGNNSHKYIKELYVLVKYGNFVLDIQNFEKTPHIFQD